MSTSVISRKLPNSNISRQKALNTMVKKNGSILAPAKSALTADTIERLNTDNTSYDSALANVVTKKALRFTAKNLADTKRVLLRSNISGVFTSVNNNISLGNMPIEARAFYGLNTSNKKSPTVSTDLKLALWGKRIIDGDAARVLAGGIALSNPTILQFTTIFTSYNTVITALSTTKTAVSNAITSVNNLNPEMDSLLLHATNEVETTYSELPAAAKRDAAREWGVRYVSVGSPAVISGIITNKVTALPLEGVRVHLSGGKNKTLTDSTGKYNLRTNLFGDLELIADLLNYTETLKGFQMINGVDMTVDFTMTAE